MPQAVGREAVDTTPPREPHRPPAPPAGGAAVTSGLEDAIHAAVRDRVRGRVVDLVVRVTDEGVTLDGVADSFHAKQLAQEAVRGLFPVRIAANRLRVRPSGGNWRHPR